MKEADLKRAVEDYLQYKMNAGELYFDRLNSGEFIEVRGNTRRRVKGCRKGTADFFVLTCFQCGLWIPRLIFLECKGENGRQTPEQKEFERLVKTQLSDYHIIRSIEDLEEALR